MGLFHNIESLLRCEFHAFLNVFSSLLWFTPLVDLLDMEEEPQKCHREIQATIKLFEAFLQAGSDGDATSVEAECFTNKRRLLQLSFLVGNAAPPPPPPLLSFKL